MNAKPPLARPGWPGAALTGVRALIDGVDDGLLLLLAGRRGLVALAARARRLESGRAKCRPEL